MRGFNRAVIAGNLTRDPEVRYTVNKKAYARMTVAVNYSYKDPNGEYKDGTDFINVTAWNATAETCGKYLKKGSPILVEGRIRTGSYDAKDGSGKKYTTEIMIDNMVMLGSGQNNISDGGERASYQRPASQDYGASSSYIPSDDEFGSTLGESGGFSGDISQEPARNFNSGNAEEDTGIPF